MITDKYLETTDGTQMITTVVHLIKMKVQCFKKR